MKGRIVDEERKARVWMRAGDERNEEGTRERGTEKRKEGRG